MQPLKDYLNESSIQYEGILDPDQSRVMNRMTDEMIRSRIREYCTYDGKKYYQGELWTAANYELKIDRIDKDNKGWYIETKSFNPIWVMSREKTRSFYDHCLSKGQKIDKQKGFLIEDVGVYFRWRRHKGTLAICDAPYFESTEGLPEELDILDFSNCCQKSKKLDIRNNINIIYISMERDLKISGNGCKTVIIYPDDKTYNITAPSQTKILRPKTGKEYWDLRK